MGKPAPVKSFLAEIYHVWITERPAQFAAALAYYAIFSFVPVIYIALTVAGIFIDELRTAEELYRRIGDLLSPEMAQSLQDAVSSLEARTTGGTPLTTIIGFVALLFTASMLFFQLQHALNTLWKVPPPKRGGTRAYITNRLLAFVMVIGLGLLCAAASVVNILITTLSSWTGFGGSLPFSTVLAVVLIATLMLALIYKALPNAKVAWRDVWLGSAVTAVLLTVGVFLLGLYLGASRFNSALEAAGAVAVFLMAFYFVGQIFVFGALFIRVYASMFGSEIQPRVPAEETARLDAGQPAQAPSGLAQDEPRLDSGEEGS